MAYTPAAACAMARSVTPSRPSMSPAWCAGFSRDALPSMTATRSSPPASALHFIGGHTMGLQAVRVLTRRGWVVVASDAAHLYANIEEERPYPIIYNLGDMLAGYGKLRRLASTPAHVVPGHDPLVMKRYPAARKELDGIAVRLDAEPKA